VLQELRPSSVFARRWNRALYRAIDPLVHRIAASGSWAEAERAAVAIVKTVVDDWFTKAYAAGASDLHWIRFTDLLDFDDPISERQAHALIARAAAEWLATPPRCRPRLMRRWERYDLFRMAATEPDRLAEGGPGGEHGHS